MSNYVWIIDRDHLHDPDGPADDEAGTIGPHDADPALIARLRNGRGARFIMFDDDGERYYSGRIICVADAELLDHADAPLVDFGAPNAGCTRISFSKVNNRQPAGSRTDPISTAGTEVRRTAPRR